MNRRKWMVAGGVAVLCASLTGLAFGATPIQLIVNGQTVSADVTPEIKNDRVMVPLRVAAEALGADVQWNEKQRTVNINSANSDLSQQLMLLQQGLAAKTPKETVQTWAEAVQNRNGAVQFAVLSPDLKEKTRSHYEQLHWVTGVSSPWVDKVNITKEEKSDDNTWEFEVEFQLKTSTGNAGLESASLKVKEIDGSWYITQVLGGTDGGI
ncbi:copper amine oxidase N-terminal domain-containing protein [Ammoniphilus resinae]|uniref:Copper amine oxidase-like N-terminal domain-containing protein n=1 Tax=Ammoniphilus resinae TaxID=861532 RepID=A0ABS4GJX9_9BACL|nr:copper amine oxidase N-terminal domain-containing protein [Ammoniphilus resinae]MBP1930566.1 hypothetical protein [Ammoniphilus resinae]